uniref:Uncharacterized protein n=1 Tax=Lotus japonicus TaxID=34305 RepID=I3S792_LOTJA|nr:unknown [Lotus japonicus]
MCLVSVSIIYTNPLVCVPKKKSLDFSCKYISAQKTGTNPIAECKDTHESHIKLLKFQNHCSEFYDLESSDLEAAVGKHAYLAVVF